MGHNPYATWFEDFLAKLPVGITYEKGFYVFGKQKFSDYRLAIKYYDEQVRRGWKPAQV